MTENDFDRWYADYCRTFPAALAWLNDLPADIKQHQKRTWALALSEVELSDALAATLRMAVGDSPAVLAYERELTGAQIRKLANEIASDRATRNIRTREAAKNFSAGPDDKRGPSLGGLYREIVAVLDAGGSQADALAMVNAAFPPQDDRRERYLCPRCRDQRFIYVWSGISIKAVLDGTLETAPKYRKAATVYCECCRTAKERAWSDKPESKKRDQDKPVFFDADRHCICPMAGVDDPENIATLRAWVGRKTSIESRPNYEPAFAAYNRGDAWEGNE